MTTARIPPDAAPGTAGIPPQALSGDGNDATHVAPTDAAERTETSSVAVVKGRATVLDVARLAGVSGRTVSRVIAGGNKVSPSARERVLAAVHTLRFRPNRLAQDLRSGGVSTTVGFVVGDLTNPFYMKVAAGIERVVGEAGLTMLLTATKDDASLEPRTVSALLEHRVRALLLVPIGDDHAYLEHEHAMGTPIVAVDRPAANVALDSVVFDNRGGAAEAVRAFVAAGHRRIAFIGSGGGAYTHTERLAGFRQAVADAGLVIPDGWVRSDATDSDSAQRAAQEILQAADPPTAIFVSNNVTAMGVLRLLHRRRPSIGFIAFDDFPLAETLGVSVIAHDPDRMGLEAAQMALSQNDDEVEQIPRQIVLPTWLISRGSEQLSPWSG